MLQLKQLFIQFQREVDFHDNVIRFYGVTTSSKDDQRKDAVSCLHDEGIMHRDLHSNNVLIHQNIVKLADFGLREEPIPNISKDYIKIYTDCWNIEPDNRPTINQVY
ncbi:unnamed protein product [Rhizophagus irregularis]|nr:unnamed protein product [Rhizophagus irregularis]